MMKRVVSVWLPRLATERLRRNGCGPPAEAPFAIAGNGSVRRLLALDGAARRAGLKPGMSVADALAVVPGLVLAPADPDADHALLEHLAEWCGHYTPWTAIDGWSDGVEGCGLWLDVSGCAHLFGGEDAMLEHLSGRLRKFGFTTRAALADTPGAAWAWARFGPKDQPCLPPQGGRDALAPLPVAALRLRPATASTLVGLGLRRIGDLYPVPRAGLAARFGREVAHRLDQALGTESEPISPRRPPPSHSVHAALAEPISRPEDVAEAVRRLLVRLCRHLEDDGLGLRRLEITAFRVDASVRRIGIGTSRPSHDPKHLFRVLGQALPELDAGFGIEVLRLSATEIAPHAAEQTNLAAAGERNDDFARLLDSLGNRLGFDKVMRFAPHESHLPERAVRPVAATVRPQGAWPKARRPVHLFTRPEPVEAMAPVPDSPPLSFRWRKRTHRVVRADGAERIAAEWWRKQAPERDYYLVEDELGRRFWLFREGLYGGPTPPRWYLHGIFP
jgi:protein ImuB